jgi:glycosidase
VPQGRRSAHPRALAALLVALASACSSGGGGTPAAATPIPDGSAGWWNDAVVYEIFVRSFADSGADGVGDLDGLTAKLDYLNDGDPTTTTDLGVDAIWLMPIFPSPSYHGYDVTDYQGVHPQYGTLAGLDALVAAAHARGIRVLLDFVPNHSSSAHPWFQDAVTGTSAAHRDWYVWSATQPTGWSKPFCCGNPWSWSPAAGAWYYALFSSSMPDLNWRSAGAEAAILAAMRFWLARGVDGFRLDAVRYLVEDGASALQDTPATHAALQRMRAAIHAEYPQALLLGEAWANVDTVARYYGAGNELNLAFSFDVEAALTQAVGAGDASPLVNAIARTEAAYAGMDRRYEAPFLSNHDQVRVMRQLGGDAAAARVAAATLFALPGTPVVYYGEELGMRGGALSRDEEKRTFFRWNATGPGYGFTTGTPWWAATEAAGVDVESARADAGSLWHLYRRLIEVRHAAPGLRAAEAVRPAVSGGGPGVFALLRGAAAERVLFVSNLAASATGGFSVAVSGAPAVLDAEGLTTPVTSSGGSLAFPGLAPRSYAFVSVQ